MEQAMSLWGLKKLDIEGIHKIFSQFSEVKEVRIFGSRAMGNFKPGSDVDLALFGDGSLECTTRIRAKLNEDLPLPYFFDVVDYTQVTNPDFRDHINHFGQIFYTRKS